MWTSAASAGSFGALARRLNSLIFVWTPLIGESAVGNGEPTIELQLVHDILWSRRDGQRRRQAESTGHRGPGVLTASRITSSRRPLSMVTSSLTILP